MGFKYFPMCLHLSLQHEADLSTSGPASTVRLILYDGRIRIFQRAVAASELMSANPLHFICSSDSFFIGQKVPQLAAGDLLLPGQSYFLLPSKFFSSALSFVSLASSFSTPSKILLLRPFEVKKTAAGKLQLRLTDEFVEGLREEGEEAREEGEKKEGILVCTTEEMKRDYRELVVRSRIWKPKLETISESEKKRGGGSSGGGGVAASLSVIRRSKKNSHGKEKKDKQHY